MVVALLARQGDSAEDVEIIRHDANAIFLGIQKRLAVNDILHGVVRLIFDVGVPEWVEYTIKL